MLKTPKVLLVDNYDSFTYNLKALVGIFTPYIEVLENDNPKLLEKNNFTHLVLSPGPKDPSDSGCCINLVKKWGPLKPLLGVCLGHQALVEAYGGKTVKAPYPVHGKTSIIKHKGGNLFKGIPDSFKGARYHSLIVERKSLPKVFRVSAEYDNIIMALSHRDYSCLHGVQFHPESFLSEDGEVLMKNFLQMTY